MKRTSMASRPFQGFSAKATNESGKSGISHEVSNAAITVQIVTAAFGRPLAGEVDPPRIPLSSGYGQPRARGPRRGCRLKSIDTTDSPMKELTRPPWLAGGILAAAVLCRPQPSRNPLGTGELREPHRPTPDGGCSRRCLKDVAVADARGPVIGPCAPGAAGQSAVSLLDPLPRSRP